MSGSVRVGGGKRGDDLRFPPFLLLPHHHHHRRQHHQSSFHSFTYTLINSIHNNNNGYVLLHTCMHVPVLILPSPN